MTTYKPNELLTVDGAPIKTNDDLNRAVIQAGRAIKAIPSQIFRLDRSNLGKSEVVHLTDRDEIAQGEE